MNNQTIEILKTLREIEIENWNSKYWREFKRKAEAEGKKVGPATGASAASIQALLNFTETDLPTDYLDFLRFSDGILGDLYSVEKIIEDSYQVRKFMPGGIAVGNNGGPNLYVIDTRGKEPQHMEYVQVSTRGLSWNDVQERWVNFHDLIAYMFQETLSERI